MTRDNAPKKKVLKPQTALLRLEALCAKSEQCTFDLSLKLARWGLSLEESDKIIKQLQKSRFVDDRRFAVAYCRDKYRFARWGRVKIAMGLRAKRVASQYISEALESIDAAEYEEALVSVIRTKAKTIKEVDTYEGRTKLFRHAASKGFETSLIVGVIKNRREAWLCRD